VKTRLIVSIRLLVTWYYLYIEFGRLVSRNLITTNMSLSIYSIIYETNKLPFGSKLFAPMLSWNSPNLPPH